MDRRRIQESGFVSGNPIGRMESFDSSLMRMTDRDPEGWIQNWADKHPPFDRQASMKIFMTSIVCLLFLGMSLQSESLGQTVSIHHPSFLGGREE